MMQFSYSSVIDAPIATVWAFHERPDVLQLLTPPWQPVEVIRREGGLGVGAESEFKLSVGPVPVRWIAQHSAYEPHQYFVDVQIEGPFAHWQHRHLFETERGKTRLTDAIAFSLPGGWVIDWLGGWAVQAQLERLFNYRHQVTRRYCEPPTHEQSAQE
jgi:ligand-binding SRPBCC domain-containing protein